MTNYEWLLQMGGEERQAWFDAEHVDATCNNSGENVTYDSREKLEAEYAEPRKVNMKRYFKPFTEAAQRAIDVEKDSREKLEDDVVHECARPGFGPEFGEIMAWLNRQAAITAEETSDAWEEYRDATQREIAELTAERDALARDLAECDENRIEFRDQRDHAEEMLAQMEKERDYWMLHTDCWADKCKEADALRAALRGKDDRGALIDLKLRVCGIDTDDAAKCTEQVRRLQEQVREGGW